MAALKLDSIMEFRRLVANTARQLTPANLEELHYIYNLPVQLKDCSALSLLQELQQRGHFSSAVDLGTMLRSISREDLAQAVGEYRPFRLGREFNITLAQLRAKCDANIAQVNSLLGELKKIQVSLRHGSLPPDGSAQLWQHFEEFERDAYALLGRCESAHKCCALSQSQSVPSENRAREGDRTGSRQSRDPHIQTNGRAGPSPGITPGQKHPCLGPLSKENGNPSTSTIGSKSLASLPPPPPDTVDHCTKDGADYDESEWTIVGPSFVKYYASRDLVVNRKDLQTTDNGHAQGSPHGRAKTVLLQAHSAPSLSTSSRVQSIARKIYGCSIAAARTAETRGMGMAKTQKAARPQVPKKPDFKSSRAINIPARLTVPSSASTPNLAHHTSESNMEESGYFSCSSSGSWSNLAGNSVTEWTKGNSHPPFSKEWPSSLREPNYYKGLNGRYSECSSDYL